MGDPLVSLSFVICTRNDGYMGNPMWRLQTSLNYLAAQLAQLGRLAEVEVLVADWGSRVAVNTAVQLSAEAARITTFLVIPPATAAIHNQDSPFAEVFPINAAVRRAQGAYIARIDQDTLVTASFLLRFYEQLEKEADSSEADPFGLVFSARRQVPYFYTQGEYALGRVAAFITTWGGVSAPEEGRPFYSSPVGVVLAHRRIWHDARGYDERLIYYWYMDLDFIKRVSLHHPVLNFGQRFGYDIFHLEHFPLWHWRGAHRQLNSETVRVRPVDKLAVNGAEWGMAECSFDTVRVAPSRVESPGIRTGERLRPRHFIYWRSGAWALLHRLRISVARVARSLKPR